MLGRQERQGRLCWGGQRPSLSIVVKRASKGLQDTGLHTALAGRPIMDRLPVLWLEQAKQPGLHIQTWSPQLKSQVTEGSEKAE